MGPMGIWQYLFLIVTYTAFAACLYVAFRKGLTELLVISLLLILYWLLESYGHHRVPLYHYPPVFPDMIPHFDWSQVSWAPPPLPNPCNCGPNEDYDAVPLAILFLQTSLTYSVMWTARLLTGPLGQCGRYLQPFLVAVVLLAVDAVLDPLAAISRDCMTFACTETQSGSGIGIWEWFVYEGLGLKWLGIAWFKYDVPLFNQAMWFAGPVVLVALLNILGWAKMAYEWLAAPVTIPPPPAPSLVELIFLLIIFFAALIVIVTSPAALTIPVAVQNAILALIVVVSIVVCAVLSPNFAHGFPFEWALAYPVIAVTLFSLAVFFFGGFTLVHFWILVLVTTPLVVWYAISPYL